jgi:ribosomal protein S18 acetylase RimI-like enzyme
MALAYAQEARLLQIEDFPPVDRTVDDIRTSDDFHLGAWVGEHLAGVLSIGPDDEPRQLCITGLVVRPDRQRAGVGRALLEDALARGQGMAFAVSTAAGNTPALALYQALGFVPYRYGVVGAKALPLVKLRRAA